LRATCEVELAIAGRDQEQVEINCCRSTVAQAVEDYELQELVEFAREQGAA